MIRTITPLIKSIVPPRKRYVLRQVLRWGVALRYGGNRVYCPCCDRNFNSFIRWDQSDPADDNYVCPYCSSQSRHRLLWHYLHHATALFRRPVRLLHFAPEYFFWKAFRKQGNIRYVPVDLASGLADAKLDIARLPFRDGVFDAFICNHVLEHIVDDGAAMRELYRVLKPGGWGITLVPVDYARASTFEDFSAVTSEQRLRSFGQVDHVRIYGKDFPKRLEDAGFDVETRDYAAEMENGLRERYGLMKREHLFICGRR